MDYIYLIIALSFFYVVIDSFFSYKKYKKMKEVCDDFNVLSSDYYNLLSDRDELRVLYDELIENHSSLKELYDDEIERTMRWDSLTDIFLENHNLKEDFFSFIDDCMSGNKYS